MHEDMYGLVNQAIEDLVTGSAGPQVWAAVLRRAGCDIQVFISNESYDDAITYRLVGAVAEELQVPADEILRRFGRHWVLQTARDSYGPLLANGGATLEEFLRNLPNFHHRVVLIFPALRPPNFSVVDASPGRIRLRYESHRPGLAQFVVGLLHGLGEMYATPVTVTHESRRDDGAAHDDFVVRW